MRTLKEIDASAVAERPFSNMTQVEVWAANWCGQCIHDEVWGIGGESAECPLLTVAVCHGKTPIEWLTPDVESRDRYSCIEFRAEEGGGDPEPEPGPIPGQGELFPRDQFVGTRMFADVVTGVREAVSAC